MQTWNDTRRPWIHLAGWLGLYLFWIGVFQNRAFALSRTLTVEFCYLLFIAANYYYNVALIIPRLLHRRKYVLFGLAYLGGILLTALLRVPLASYLNRAYFLKGLSQPVFIVLWTNSVINIFIWVTCILAAKLAMDRRRLQQTLDRVEQERLRTELAFLNAQFNPHFLFNSLNSIYGQIDKSNALARSMLLAFADMLRYQLYECNTDLIGIDKELQFVRNYIALQQARREEGLKVCLQIDPEVKGFFIAPLLFIAFIENAFKYTGHGEEAEGEGGRGDRIELSFRKHGDDLVFTSFNTKQPGVRHGIPQQGIGIANVKRRLELLYPGKYQLDLRDHQQTYTVMLKIYLK